jgi:tyrosinase
MQVSSQTSSSKQFFFFPMNALTSLVSIFLLLVALVAGQCRIRKEVHDLSDAEWSTLIDALRKIKNQGSGLESPVANCTTSPQTVACRMLSLQRTLGKTKTYATGWLSDELTSIYDALVPSMEQSPSLSSYDDFVDMHRRLRHTIHSPPLFLPWHRRFVYELESLLRTIDPSITIPYWQWSSEPQPHRSLVFRRFGTSSGTDGGCIPDGPFRDWHFTSDSFGGDCIRRAFDPQTGRSPITNWIDGGECVRRIQAQSDDGSTFETRLTAIHDRFHWWVGADMSDTRYSPKDPVFYLHHAFIDKIWTEGQAQHSSWTWSSVPELPGFEGQGA